MKRIISLVAIAAMTFAMAGCAVNASTGGITVINMTDKAVSGAKIGQVFVGYIGAGQTVDVYFSSEETAASINFTGFETQTAGLNGTIDLKKNYSYAFYLMKNDGKYVYTGDGRVLNYDNTTSPSTDDVRLK